MRCIRLIVFIQLDVGRSLRISGAIERLYRHDIGDGVDLAHHAVDFRTIYNSIRPYEAIAMVRPLERYRQTPITNVPDAGSVSDS